MIEPNITYIDGHPCLFRLPTGGKRKDSPSEWDTIIDKLGDQNDLFHWKNMFSWCQDTVYPNSMYRTRRGFYTAHFWDYEDASYQGMWSGFRPVLVPLDPSTLTPDSSRIADLPDGATLKLGTLTMGGRAVQLSQNPATGKDIPHYDGGELRIVDTDACPEHQITWVKCGDILIADRNLLGGISWEDLARQGLVFCEEAAEKENQTSPRLDGMIQNAFAKSRKQADEKVLLVSEVSTEKEPR